MADKPDPRDEPVNLPDDFEGVLADLLNTPPPEDGWEEDSAEDEEPSGAAESA